MSTRRKIQQSTGVPSSVSDMLSLMVPMIQANKETYSRKEELRCSSGQIEQMTL